MAPPEVKARALAEKKEAEAKEAERQARVARWQEVQWRKAMERSARVEEEADFLYKQAKGAKRIAAAWRYQAKVYSATESEIAYAPTQSDQLVAEERRRVADSHVKDAEAEEEALAQSVGRPPRSKDEWKRRQRRRMRF